MYSWWWVGLSPETCRVKAFAKNKPQLLHLVGIYFHYYKAWCTEPQILNIFIVLRIWILFSLLSFKPSNLFWNDALHVSDSSSVHHQELFRSTHSSSSEQEQVLVLTSCQQNCMTYTIAVCTVKNSWWLTDELSDTCRISFQNEFEKLVHLVGFIVRNAFKPSEWNRVSQNIHSWIVLCIG